MKTPNFSIAFIAFILMLSCINTTHPDAPGVYVDPCLNGGENHGCSYFGCSCDCPDGFCGEYCETKGITTYYGNYEGIMVCQGDSIVTQFKVEEYSCAGRLWTFPQLWFNDGELKADYWIVHESTPFPWKAGEISVYPKDHRVDLTNPANGMLTIDSLVFWMRPERYSLDTCFYVGVKI